MRPLLLALLCCLTACTTAPSPPIRILSYNIHHGEGTDGVFDLERLAAVIREVDPDFVALQEVDVNTKRSSGLDQASELGRLTGLHVTFGAAMPYLGGKYGDAVLSRRKPIEWGALKLPAAKNHEPRTATFVRVALDAGSDSELFTFVSTHLDHTRNEGDRLRQATAIVEHWPRSAGEDVVLAGDLNARNGTRTMQVLLKHFTDSSAANPANTFPSHQPDRRIDWILFRPEKGWRVVESRVLAEEISSDHRPLFVVLQRKP